jgi:hypothetical protein
MLGTVIESEDVGNVGNAGNVRTGSQGTSLKAT